MTKYKKVKRSEEVRKGVAKMAKYKRGKEREEK